MEYTVRPATIGPDLTGAWHGPAWQQADTLEIAHFRPEGSEHRPRTQAEYRDGMLCFSTGPQPSWGPSIMYWLIRT